MIQIKIADTKREFSTIHDIDESWITQQINRRQNDRQLVCVRVRVELDSVNVALSTATCQGTSGGCRPPNQKEAGIIDLWNKHRLNQTDFKGGQIIAFLKQLRKLLN